ncbi:MAG: hypothetical protein QG594_1653, partial [Bacteroidota bacterium]|nr:hypothetical protein [Bacteroidota bacterium]
LFLRFKIVNNFKTFLKLVELALNIE